MSTRIRSWSAVVAAALFLGVPGWALAHGGFGGGHFGGGHFGGGHFGGGHFGGGHFGGGHFGGSHFGGGGWGGGHVGGGGFRGGNMGGGRVGGIAGGAVRGGGAAGSHFGQTKLGGAVRTHAGGGIARSGGSPGVHHMGGVTAGRHVVGGPNSFVTRHVSGFSRGNNGGVRVARGTGTGSGGSGGKPGGHHGGLGWGGNGNGWNSWSNGRYGIGWGIVSSLLNSFGGYGYGYGYGGYGGYGSYGCGYGYNPYCSYGGNGFGGYASPGYYTYASAGYPLVTTNLVTTDASALTQPATVTVDNTTPTTSAAISYADNGEAAFKSGDFKGAEYALRHAVVDDPKNPVLVMMLSQALFATGKYDESAGAAQNAMQQLVKEQWGVVVTNYKDLYTSNQSYTDQLRALEKAVQDKPDSPALHFLLGFQYGYLGYPQNAVDQLNKTIKLAPRDEMAKQLLEEMQAKLPKPATSVGT